MARKPPIDTVYRIQVSLLDVEPPVHRRLLVDAETPLGELHHLLQAALGWSECHLHRFVAGERSYSDPEFELEEAQDEWEHSLADVAPRVGDEIHYEYDFGDDWRHLLRVEEIRRQPRDDSYPACVDGARACPPEDCGGSFGYEHLLEVLSDPAHEEHQELQEWVGGGFDPDTFDLDETNTRIREWA
ncbi:MAG: plasmid pRiA4b ORF-3 family protein [Planctomycetota bacterium]